MNREETMQVVKEVLAEQEPDEAIKSLDEKIEALTTKVDEATKATPEAETTPETEAAAKDKGDEETDVGALKTKVEELETGLAAQKAFRTEVEKKLAITGESQGLPGDEPATKSKPDYGSRDGAGRKIRS